ncbi:MAG: dynamin family protein [Smithella sp.]
MTQPVLSPELMKQYDSMREILQRCLSLTEKCADNEASGIIRDRLDNLQSAALFVIVGEVKSGKSSFVNALLGEDICEVAPDPCTVVIQELVYGTQRTKTNLGDHWERVALPKPVLRDISIVDTPGTNSIIRHHQTITENYIPRSDLVVFVFPAKNPYTGTAWDLLDFIRKDWRRKTVFVLQQADLATKEELTTNEERVRQYAHERNIQNPIVFSVSAKRELEGAPDSGFKEFRQFLSSAVESGDVWRMKVEGTRETAGNIVGKLLAGLRKEQSAIGEDKVFYQALLARVEARREKANALRRLVVDSLCVSYDRLSSRLESDFAEGLSVGNILRRAIPIIRDKDVKTWVNELQTQFENTAKDEIAAESIRGAKDLSDEIKSMFDELTEAVKHRQENQNKESLSLASDRNDILDRLKLQLSGIRISDIVDDKAIQGSDLGTLTLAGGGIAALGAVLALATHLMVFDITGGILALAGAGLVAATLLWKRSNILRDFSQRLANSREEFRSRLDQEIKQIFEKLFLEIQHYLQDPLSSLDEKTARIASLINEAESIKEAAGRLR